MALGAPKELCIRWGPDPDGKGQVFGGTWVSRVLGLVVRFSAGIATCILRNDKKINNVINFRKVTGNLLVVS